MIRLTFGGIGVSNNSNQARRHMDYIVFELLRYDNVPFCCYMVDHPVETELLFEIALCIFAPSLITM